MRLGVRHGVGNDLLDDAFRRGPDELADEYLKLFPPGRVLLRSSGDGWLVAPGAGSGDDGGFIRGTSHFP